MKKVQEIDINYFWRLIVHLDSGISMGDLVHFVRDLLELEEERKRTKECYLKRKGDHQSPQPSESIGISAGLVIRLYQKYFLS